MIEKLETDQISFRRTVMEKKPLFKNRPKYIKRIEQSPFHIELPEFVPLSLRDSSDQTDSTPSPASTLQNKSQSPEIDSSMKRDCDDGHNYYQNSAPLRENSQEHQLNDPYIRRMRYRSRSPHSSGSSERLERYNSFDERRDDYYSREEGGNEYRRSSRSVFTRLGGRNSHDHPYPQVATSSKSRHSPIYFENGNSQHIMPEEEYTRRMNIVVHCSNEYERSRSTACYNNQLYQADIISAIHTLEHDQQKMKDHLSGLRDTIESYFREIAKLETLVLIQSQEIDALKRKLF